MSTATGRARNVQPAMTRGHGRAVLPSREVASSYVHRAARRVTRGSLALLVLAVTAGAGASAATADDGHLTIVNQPAWYADGDPTVGTATQAVAVSTPQPCPAGTTRHKTSIVAVRAARPADQAAADRWLDWGNLYSPVAASLPGPLVAYPASMNWSSLAGLHGLRIVPGTYELATRCQDNLGRRVLREWTGEVVFDSATRYHVPARFATHQGRSASVPAPSPSVEASAGPSVTGDPSPSVTVSSGPGAPSAAGSPAGGAEAVDPGVGAVDAAAPVTSAAARSGTGWATVALAVVVAGLVAAGGVLLLARRGRDR